MSVDETPDHRRPTRAPGPPLRDADRPRAAHAAPRPPAGAPEGDLAEPERRGGPPAAGAAEPAHCLRSVATVTCGQRRPLKSSWTSWVYCSCRKSGWPGRRPPSRSRRWRRPRRHWHCRRTVPSRPRNAVLAVPPPLIGVCLVEISMNVRLLIVWPWSACCRTLLGFLTIAWVTPGEAWRKGVGVARLSSVNVWSTWLKSPLAGGGVPIPKGRMLLSGMCGGPPLDELRRALGEDRRAVRDGGHPHHRRGLLRVAGRRDVGPDPRLEMEAVPRALLGDLLHVGDPEHLDVVHQQAAVGDRPVDRREGDLVVGEVELEEAILAAAGQRMGAPDGVQAGALPGPGQLSQRSQRDRPRGRPPPGRSGRPATPSRPRRPTRP